jgi:hypothetical protein
LKGIRQQLHRTNIAGSQVEWLPYKLSGTAETKFGDVPIEIAKWYRKDKGLPTYLVPVSITYGKAESERNETHIPVTNKFSHLTGDVGHL